MNDLRIIFWLCLFLLLIFPSASVAAPLDQIPNLPQAAPSSWCAAGSFQPSGGWNNASDPFYDDGTHGDLAAGDGTLTLTYTLAKPAGYYEWKIFACGTWNGYSGEDSGNKWLYTTAANQTVTLTLDMNTRPDGYYPTSNISMAADSGAVLTQWTLVGDFQSWNKSDSDTVMIAMNTPGLYFRRYVISSPGLHQYKITSSGNWDHQFGSDGRSINSSAALVTTTAAGQSVTFILDANRPGLMTLTEHLFCPVVMH